MPPAVAIRRRSTGIAAPPSRVTVRVSGGLRILLVDDDRFLGAVLTEAFSSWGHRPTVATSVAAALTAARRLPPELVICDLNLGAGGDGFELARRLRAEPVTAGTTIVAMTGTDARDCEDQAREAGITQVLVKPVPLAVLEELVASVAGRAG
jgi:CheY-like chemotaxis protein